jgi:hypothetical protein
VTAFAGTTVFLAPPSPPFAPHLGTLYTWCLLDAAARASRHLGRDAVFPEAWNLASRRLDSELASCPPSDRQQRYVAAVASAVSAARTVIGEYGIRMDVEPCVRDDHPTVKASMAEVVTDLVDEGRVVRIEVAEKWCGPCEIAMPVSATVQTCFRCGRSLIVHERRDWFLRLDFHEILRQAESTQWLPPYALRRFRDLADINPLVRVGHFGRLVGIRSPLDHRQMLDPRLVAALYPRALRALGFGRIVTAAGQDIQRKWLTLVFATTNAGRAVDTIINHGVLLADGRHKMSRYDGATIGDLPESADPVAYRAGLLAASCGRDIVASTVAFDDSSRFRAKVHNVMRFLAAQSDSTSNEAVNLDLELGPAFDAVDRHLEGLDLRSAYMAFRAIVRTEVSHRLIPRIRNLGCRGLEPTVTRMRSLAAIFYGGLNR